MDGIRLLSVAFFCTCWSLCRSACQCLGEPGLAAALGDKAFLMMGGVKCLPVQLASGEAACYPTNYGSTCRAWDSNLPDACADMQGRPLYDRPSFCEDSWCYVHTNASCVQFYPSNYFVGLFYSYHACGSQNTFEEFTEGQGTTAGDLSEALLGYVRSTVDAAVDAMTSTTSSQCSPLTGCHCPTCKRVTGAWGVDAGVDLDNTAYYVKGTPGQKEQCLAGHLHGVYENIAAKEGITDRLGYLYFGSQGDGSMTMWPAMEWCPETLDYRFRPWYSSTASGAKDVVIIVDTSGSMGGTSGRIGLAMTATKAVLDTLVESDYVAIVRFSTTASSSYETLQPASDEVRKDLKTWADKNIMAGGATNFKAAFSKAYSILQNSRDAGMTSNCKSMVLLLSDGDPSDWGSTPEMHQASYEWLTEKAEGVGDTIIHTYALGSGITATGKGILKRLACQHRGIYHEAADGSDLGSTMAQYYTYFAVGTDSARVQWREYTDAFTKVRLLAACMSAFDKTTKPRTLLGVSCMDMNALTTLDDLETTAGYQDFKSSYQEDQKYCAPFRLSASDAQILRFRSSPGAVCEESDGVHPLTCGDGVVDANPRIAGGIEECDDGNTVSGDGCSATCKIESGWVCPPYGYIKLQGQAATFLQRPRLYCQGVNLLDPAPTVGDATPWAYCRENTSPEECREWCAANSECVGFNFYTNSWGMTNGACFRSSIKANLFLDSTMCYEKVASESNTCRDAPGYLDENNLFCDEWAGYDCSAAVTEWGYSVQGQNDLMANCRSSCGVCSGAVCHPRCSRLVSSPSQCKDCVGDWGPWGACTEGSLVQKPGGRTECVQSRNYRVTRPAEAGWGACPVQHDAADFRMVDIYNPGPWGSCVASDGKKCGAGTRTRTAPCLGDTALCSAYAADFLPVTTEPCTASCKEVSGSASFAPVMRAKFAFIVVFFVLL